MAEVDLDDLQVGDQVRFESRAGGDYVFGFSPDGRYILVGTTMTRKVGYRVLDRSTMKVSGFVLVMLVMGEERLHLFQTMPEVEQAGLWCQRLTPESWKAAVVVDIMKTSDNPDPDVVLPEQEYTRKVRRDGESRSRDRKRASRISTGFLDNG